MLLSDKPAKIPASPRNGSKKQDFFANEQERRW